MKACPPKKYTSIPSLGHYIQIKNIAIQLRSKNEAPVPGLLAKMCSFMYITLSNVTSDKSCIKRSKYFHVKINSKSLLTALYLYSPLIYIF